VLIGDPPVEFALTGQGSSGFFLPSSVIDPNNTGVATYLNALIGAFTDANGKVIEAFAPIPSDTSDADVHSTFTFSIPTGAVFLQFGVNDDIFSDNNGALVIDVTGVAPAVPELSTWAMLVLGFASVGFVAHRRKSVQTSMVAQS
jgi:hypothetical protein